MKIFNINIQLKSDFYEIFLNKTVTLVSDI